MTDDFTRITERIWDAAGDSAGLGNLTVSGPRQVLPSVFDVTGLAVADRESVRGAVRDWKADELEAAIVAAGGCAAAMHSRQDWLASPQGTAAAGAPLLDVTTPAEGSTASGSTASGSTASGSTA